MSGASISAPVALLYTLIPIVSQVQKYIILVIRFNREISLLDTAVF